MKLQVCSVEAPKVKTQAVKDQNNPQAYYWAFIRSIHRVFAYTITVYLQSDFKSDFDCVSSSYSYRDSALCSAKRSRTLPNSVCADAVTVPSALSRPCALQENVHRVPIRSATSEPRLAKGWRMVLPILIFRSFQELRVDLSLLLQPTCICTKPAMAASRRWDSLRPAGTRSTRNDASTPSIVGTHEKV